MTVRPIAIGVALFECVCACACVCVCCVLCVVCCVGHDRKPYISNRTDRGTVWEPKESYCSRSHSIIDLQWHKNTYTACRRSILKIIHGGVARGNADPGYH